MTEAKLPQRPEDKEIEVWVDGSKEPVQSVDRLAEKAKEYGHKAITTLDPDLEWRVEFIGDHAAASYDVEISWPYRTHVLIDPDFGEEEEQLQPIIRQE